MEINLTTPAVLFPAVSLLLLAYTNRFLALATLIRSLYDEYQRNPQGVLLEQISNLRYRVQLIKNMQFLGVLSLLLCVLCMLVLFFGGVHLGQVLFGLSLLLMLVSLGLSTREIQISVNALDAELRDIEKDLR